MIFDPEFLEATSREVRTRKKGKSPTVEVVHPGIILVQKASDAFGRPPRERDRDDVGAIVKHWKEEEGYSRNWNPIIETSLDALPTHQLDITLARIRQRLA
jgi:hypothetical protein